MNWKDREYRLEMLHRISLSISLVSLIVSIVALIVRLAR